MFTLFFASEIAVHAHEALIYQHFKKSLDANGILKGDDAVGLLWIAEHYGK